MSSWSPLDQNRNAPAPATGDQRTLVMLANFRDAAVSCTADAINNAMFADPTGLSVNELYRASSFFYRFRSRLAAKSLSLHV